MCTTRSAHLQLRNPVGIVENMLADNARGSGNAPWMALPTICAGALAVDEHRRSIRDSLRQSRWRYVAICLSRAPEDHRI